MTRFIGNRIGNLPSSDGYAGGGLFNTIQHLYYKQQNDWGRFTVSHSGEDLKIPYSTAGDGYNYLIYTGGGSLSVDEGFATIECMIVAGGGAGGRGSEPGQSSGGGGAGGFRSGSLFLEPGTYPISIGAGGAPAGSPTGPNPGEPSYISGPPNFASFESTGGGRGGGQQSYFAAPTGFALPGGSGGGGCSYSPFYDDVPSSGGAGNSPSVSPPQGTAGASGDFHPNSSADHYGGGGGGAGRAGLIYSGGYGRAYPFSYSVLPTSYGTPGPTDSEPPTARWFAGGGSGGRSDPNTTFTSGQTGGAGGGGDGSTPPSFPFTNGTANTGGGGGGHRAPGFSGSGGSGIIILRYKENT